MRPKGSVRFLLASVVALSAAALGGCATTGEVGKAPAPAGVPAAQNGGGKIPVTTASEEARKEFL